MPDRDQHHDEPAFKVTDRRKFTMDGALRPDTEEEKPQEAVPPPPPPPSSPAPSEPPPVAAQAESTEPPGLGMDDADYAQQMQTPFGRLVLSLTQTAMMQLGLVAVDPAQPLEPDLMGARDTIDMLGALEEKTKGNVTKQEAAMLASTVSELRMAYVGVQRRFAPRR